MKYTLLILAIIFILNSCETVATDDDLYATSWQVSKVTVNGVDKTQEFKQKYFRLINFGHFGDTKDPGYNYSGGPYYNIIPKGYGTVGYKRKKEMIFSRAVIDGYYNYYHGHFSSATYRDSLLYHPVFNITKWNVSMIRKNKFGINTKKDDTTYSITFIPIDTTFICHDNAF